MTSFRQQLNNAYDRKVVKRLEKQVRAVALIIDAQLVDRTPIDTGRAQSNWLPSLNIPEVRIVEPGQKVSITPVLRSFNIEDTIYISNNLLYIKKLNSGSSIQAPDGGFVEDAIQVGKNAIK